MGCAVQMSAAAASAELGDASAALHARLAEVQAAQEAAAERATALGSRTDKLEMLVGVVETNRNEAVQAVASVRTAIATVRPRCPCRVFAGLGCPQDVRFSHGVPAPRRL